MQESLSLSDRGCRSLSIRQRTQETLYQTADAEVSIRQRMQETLYQMQPLSDRVSSASAV